MAPMTMITAPANDSQAPVPRSRPVAAGGLLTSSMATTTNVAPTIQGSARRSRYSASGSQAARRRTTIAGDGQRGEQDVGQLEHVPRAEVAVPGEEQADQNQQRAQREHDRPDVESTAHALKDDKRPSRVRPEPVTPVPVLKLTGPAFPAVGGGNTTDQASALSPDRTPQPLLLYRAVASPTRCDRPVSPSAGHQRGGRFGEMLPKRSRPVALQPPHERDVVGGHPFRAPERFELVHEQPQLAVERGVRRLDPRAVRRPRRSRRAARRARG